MFCAPQEAAPVRSYQCASPKCAADAAIGADIGADSAGCAPLNLAARADGDGVIERVRTLLRAAPDAAPMTDARGSSRPPAFRRLPVLRGGRAEGDPTHPSRARVDPGRERGSGRGGGAGGRVRVRTAPELPCEVRGCGYEYDLWEMSALIVRASVYGTTVGVDLVSVDGKVDQEPSRDLSHVVHATLRLYGCPWEAIRLGFQLHPHKLG